MDPSQMHLPTPQVGFVLFLLPAAAYFYLLLRLSAYRRDGGGFLRTFLTPGPRALRPDLYTDEAEPFLRAAWVVAILTIPYILLVGWLLGVFP